MTMLKNSTAFPFLALFVALLGFTAEAVNNHVFVRCETTKGPLTIEVSPEWAPIGATRFLDLVYDGFYTDIALFRSVDKFLTQFGISDKPEKQHWHTANIPDDTNLNFGIQKYDIAFAGSGPNSRSTQLFIAYEDLDFLGHESWETPFGKVISSDETVEALFKGYEDIVPFANGPDQQKLYEQGNDYIRKEFPQADFIKYCAFAGMVKDPEPEAEVVEGEQAEPAPEDL